jgi:hypothetical protein
MEWQLTIRTWKKTLKGLAGDHHEILRAADKKHIAVPRILILDIKLLQTSACGHILPFSNQHVLGVP